MAMSEDTRHDVFCGSYYGINYFYLRVIGFWPYDNYKIIKRLMVIFAIISMMVPMTIRLYEEWNRDFDVAVEIVGGLIYFGGSLVKYGSFLRVEKQMICLFDKIADDWRSITFGDEMKKLKEYGGANRRLVLGYLIPINMILMVYVTVPLAPVILDIMDPLNETRPRGFPNYIEFFIDQEKYFIPLTVHGWIVCILSVQIFGAFDTTYVIFVQHACALFRIVEIRLQRAIESVTTEKYSNRWQREEMEYRNTRAAILQHKEVIQFIDEINNSYSLVFFLTVTCSSAVICLAAVVAMLSLETGNLKHATRYALCYVGYSLHLLYNMSPGQRVIDHSTNIRNAVFNCEWYNASPRTRQLLKIVMLRSLKPCKFTGQKMIELNLDNFANVFRKSISYVTVIGSMRCTKKL